eukprot:1097936-Rhodomonas_salina.1
MTNRDSRPPASPPKKKEVLLLSASPHRKVLSSTGQCLGSAQDVDEYCSAGHGIMIAALPTAFHDTASRLRASSTA